MHDQEFKTLHQEISVLRQDMTNQITTIHLKIDTIVRVINDHYLKQGIEIEKLQDIHPKNSHQPVVV